MACVRWESDSPWVQTEMKNQKGFIQIPLFIAIIAGVLVLGGGGYFGVKKYQNYQAEEVEKQKEAEAQQIALQETQREIEKLKEQSILTEKRIQSGQKAQPKNFSISAAELRPYLTGIIEITCKDEGSGSLWDIAGRGFFVLTNRHVLENTSDICWMDIEEIGSYILDISDVFLWNNLADIAYLKIKSKAGVMESADEFTKNWVANFPEIEDLNYKISTLNKCNKYMSIGSPVVIVGYPAFGKRTIQIGTSTPRAVSQISTNGIISGYDVAPKTQGLPYENYFVSAKIDSGNSGGIAFSKDENGLCVLGIPTWLTVGNYETQGVVQNIYNVLYEN